MDRAIPYYAAGEGVEMTVPVPANATAQEVNLSWQVVDWTGAISQTGSVKLPNLALTAATITLKPLPSGWYEAEFLCDGQSLGKQAFVEGDYYKSLGGRFRYGVCSHLLFYKGEQLDKVLQLHKALGIDVVRTDLSWNVVQKGENQPFNFDRADFFETYLNSNGIETAFDLTYGTSWAAIPASGQNYGNSWRYAPRMEPWLAYVTACVEHYQKTVKYWEIWNEPDIGFWLSPVSDYTHLFNTTAATILKVNPKARVINGGLAMVSRPPNPDFVAQFLSGADRTNWSTYAYHDYITYTDMPIRYKTATEGMAKVNLKLPIWINEGGFHTLMPGGEKVQAVTLVKKLATAAAFGVKGYFWYDLIDDGAEPKNSEHHFGLARNNFEPKPAFAAYRELIYQVADRPVSASQIGDPANICVVSYGDRKLQSTAKSVHVVWKESPGPDEPMWVASDSATSTLRVFDLMGKPVGAPISNGGGLVRIGGIPVYIQASDGTKLQVTPVLKIPERLVVLPQSSQTISFTVTNPHPAPLKISAELSCNIKGAANPIAPPWRGDFTAGEIKTVNFQLTEVQATSLAQSGVDHAELAISFGADADPQRIGLPLAFPEIIGGEREPWHIALDSRDHIVNLHEGEPNPDLHWSGPGDLSLDSFLRWQPEGLRLIVNVTDDVQSQPYSDAALWKGDCLQIALCSADNPSDTFEACFGLLKTGLTNGWIFHAPKTSFPAGPMPDSVKLQVTRQGTLTHYDVIIPWKCFGSDDVPTTPLLFNFIVNDDDGAGRKQWMQNTRGMGEGTVNARLFKTFVLKK